MHFQYVLLISLILIHNVFCIEFHDDWQVHLSLVSSNSSEMMVTWILTEKPASSYSYVSYGTSENKLTMTAKAEMTEWHHSEDRYTFRAKMRNLESSVKYYYNVGSSIDKSITYSFIQPDHQKPLRAAIFGDFSHEEGYSMIPLIKAAEDGDIDIAIHIGDIAYSLDSKNGKRGDEFLNIMQPLTSRIPYMVLPGNHEVKKDFIEITNRFTMPNNGVYDNNLFWSVDYGNTHLVALNSEYYPEGMHKKAEKQYEWLVSDLAMNKNKWNIVMIHRPFYCSWKSKHGCHDSNDTVVRDGDNRFPGLERVLDENHVDLVIYGHKHTYERMWPISKGKPFKSSNPNHIVNAQAPIYILNGAAGCHSHTSPPETIPQDFSIFRAGNYGFLKLTVHNSTHTSTEFIDTDNGQLNGPVVDSFVLEKE